MQTSASLTRHLLRRGLFLWLLVRAVFALALLLTLSPPTANGGVVAIAVVALTVALGLVELQRLEERVLMANLGVATFPQIVMLALVPLTGEVFLALLLP